MSLRRNDLESSTIGTDFPEHGTTLQVEEDGGSDFAEEEFISDVSSLESDSDPGDPDRPNKYGGPRSTWMDWTADERAIADGLDLTVARNLSVHLYNAHRLEVDAFPRNTTLTKRQREWRPPKSWTAWPLPYDEVPREHEANVKSYLGEPTVRSSTEPSSRQLLEDILIATMSKKARLRFQSRKPEPADSSHTDELKEPEGTAKEVQNLLSSSYSPDRATIECDEPAAGENRPGKNRIPEAKDSTDLVPYPLVDDDEIANLLRRPARHTLEQLEKLLTALHHSRNSYKDCKYSSDSSDNGASSNDTSSMPSQAERQASGGRSRSRKASRGPTRRKSKDAISRCSRGSSTSRQSVDSIRRADLLRTGLREWDDVLGFAGAIGWDKDVLYRTRLRCEQLFGESSCFATAMDYFETGYTVETDDTENRLYEAPESELEEVEVVSDR